jgi:hypothetical protein
VDPVPDPLLLRESGSAGNITRDLWVSSQELLTTEAVAEDTILFKIGRQCNLPLVGACLSQSWTPELEAIVSPKHR